MPLYKLEKINETRQIAIWHVEESLRELENQLRPLPVDRKLLKSFRNEKKKIEWVCGRLCLAHLCREMGITYEGVIKNDRGKPFLRNNTAEISLTHSYPYVAAIIDKNIDVGIDLEQPKEKLINVAHKFLNEREKEHAGSNITILCIHWCAKETLYKILDQRIIFKDQMHIEPFLLAPKGTLIGKVIVNDTIKSYILEYRIENDYILTYNIANE